MFVAIRDLRRARGRFALITLVVVLVSVLVTFLGGLTAGLRHQNISALQSLPGSMIVFADTGSAPSFDQSVLTTSQIAIWQHRAEDVVPVGISRDRATSTTHTDPMPVVLFGLGGNDRPVTGTVDVAAPIASSLGLRGGQAIQVGGRTMTVGRIVGDQWYAHSPVIYLPIDTWRDLAPQFGAATVLAVTPRVGTDTQSVAASSGTTIRSGSDALSALASYSAENSSLTLMTVMLLLISALVIGAFFTVWTVQRVPDIAVLKALGASTASLVRDALGQAVLILVVGCGLGVAVAVGGGTLLGSIPFVVTASTTLLPALATIGLGVLGAGAALHFLITTDPLTALGSNR
ncbi:MAG: ABC transporter permease [Gordonia polyisoprenivorans]|nr:ABC transporter permease [Gordonia polyisoprenivorans]